MPKIISIEGNIGAGKSTIFAKLQTHFANNPKVVFMKEPVDMWDEFTDENGENMLVNYYRDPSKYSFGFQIMVYSTQIKIYMDTLRENPLCEYIISERSMDAAHHVFTKMLKEDGHIDEIHFKIYESLYNAYNLNYIIYVDVDPLICYDRVNERHRDGEHEISIDYLYKCQEYYLKWLIEEDETFHFNYLSRCRKYYDELHRRTPTESEGQRCTLEICEGEEMKEGEENATPSPPPPRVVMVDGNNHDDGEYCAEVILYHLNEIMKTKPNGL